MSLPDSLERAASALANDAEDIRPANGDPNQLLSLLDATAQCRVLNWLLTNEPESGEELAVAWAEAPEGTQPLLELKAADLPKAGRKALRRALHRLRSRGIEVATNAGRKPVVARLPSIEDSFEMAFVSSLDPRGSRIVYLVEPNPTGGARLFEVLLDDLRGVVDFELYAAGRSKVREFIKRLRSRQGWSVVEADPAAVRAMVARADARQPADRPSPRSFLEWRLHLARDVADRTPGEALADTSPGDAQSQPAALKRVGELVLTGELGPWPPPTSRLEELGERVREQTESKLIVSGNATAERLDQAVAHAAGELFVGDFAEVTAIRFQESAYVFSKRDRAEDAAACVSAALAFRETPAKENPVARALLEKCLGSFLASLRDKDKDKDKSQDGEGDGEGGEPPLIVEP